MDAVIGKLKSFFDSQGLILMTTSGIELDHKSPFFGPHVGSYYNKLVKRCLLEMRLPTVIFLDQEKFPYPFKPGKCHPVCGPDFSWEMVISEIPLAFALASDNKDQYIFMLNSLKGMGFERQGPEIEENGIWPLLVANKCFMQAFINYQVSES